MKLTSKLQRELARQFAQVSILERAVIGMADVLPLSDSEILRFTNLLAKKTLSAQRKEREAVRNRINSIRASGTEAAEDVLPRMRTLPSNPPKTKPTQADFVAWAKEMTGADEPTLEEQVAVDPNDFEENYAKSSGLYGPAPSAGTVIIGGKIVSVQ